MIKLYLPSSYEMLNGQDLYVQDTDKYNSDSVYLSTSDPAKYEEFLNELFEIAKPTQKRFLEVIKNFILHYTQCFSAPLDSPRFYYTRHKILVAIPLNKLEAVNNILSTPFFYIAATMNYNTRALLYTAKAANITAFLLSKIASRPLEFSEISPRVIQLLVGWFLKKYNLLTPQNLSKHCIRAKRGFTNPQELKEVYQLIKDIKSLDDFFEHISKLMSIQTLRQSFVTRFGIDVALLFDDMVHLIYNVATSMYLNYPAVLSQYLIKGILQQDAAKIANSISSRFYTLPKF